MQQELVDLQPKLIETSRETEELIAIIEKETVEVEEKKKIVEQDEAVATEAANVAKAIKVRWLIVRWLRWEWGWLGDGLVGRGVDWERGCLGEGLFGRGVVWERGWLGEGLVGRGVGWERS